MSPQSKHEVWVSAHRNAIGDIPTTNEKSQINQVQLASGRKREWQMLGISVSRARSTSDVPNHCQNSRYVQADSERSDKRDTCSPICRHSFGVKYMIYKSVTAQALWDAVDGRSRNDGRSLKASI